MEGSAGSDIVIENNLIENGTAPAIFIGGYLNKSDIPLPADSRANIKIIGNKVRQNTAPAIVVHGCTGLAIENNDLQLFGNGGKSATELKNVENLTETGNTINISEAKSAPSR
jgi:hypothetical protein